MLLEAIKHCPQGQQPGQRFTAPDEHARVLILVGAAKEVTDDVPQPVPVRRPYRRRDLSAE